MPPSQMPQPSGNSRTRRRGFFTLRRTLVVIAGILAIIVTLALGTWGFYCHWLGAAHPPEVGTGRMLIEAFWRTIQLFTVESVYDETFLSRPVGLELHVARALAVLISVSVAGGVIYAVSRDTVKRLLENRIERSKGHYVVCGLGRRSIEFVRELIERKERVVAIELNPQGEHILECRDARVRVLVGSATDRALLKRAGVLTAGWLIAFTGDDSTNAEVAVRARELVKGKRDNNNPLRCRVHLVDPALNQVFKQHPVYTEERDPFDAHPFNTYENAARLLLQKILGSPYTKPHQACTHLIIHGFGPMGQAVLLQAARMGHLGPGYDFRVTLLGVSDAAFYGFEAHYPAIREVCRIDRRTDGPDHPDVRRYVRRVVAWERTETAIVVCLENDPDSCHAALSLLGSPREPVARVYVELTSPVGLVSLFGDNVANHPELEHLHPFGQPKETSSCDLVLQAPLDRKAKAIHHHFRTGQLPSAVATWKESRKEAVRDQLGSIASLEQLDALLKACPTLDLDGNDNMRPWEKLAEDFRESNRQAADHLPIKLRHIGCYAANAKDKKEGDAPATLADDEVDFLAQMEHARWCAERRLARWTWGREKDHQLRTNPNLVPWDRLPEGTKEWNRQTIRHIPQWLAAVEEKVYRHHA